MKKVLLGLSGGVDSAVAGKYLLEKGFDVCGAFLNMHGYSENGYESALSVAKSIDIDLIKIDLIEAFKEIVIKNFINEYSMARTPNPCVVCNPNVKFKGLYDYAIENGFDNIATGHYARVVEKDNLFYIKRKENDPKDQSYVMYRLGQDILSRLMLPIGEFESKAKVREYAKKANLPVYNAPDSQEICFLPPDVDYKQYLIDSGLILNKGNFIDKNGCVLGQHKGIINYTIGQRRGLEISLGKRVFVTKINKETNEVVIGENDDLMVKEIKFKDAFFSSNIYQKEMNVYSKIRYNDVLTKAKIILNDDKTGVAIFENEKRASCPGQSIVFYDENLLLGGAIIC